MISTLQVYMPQITHTYPLRNLRLGPQLLDLSLDFPRLVLRRDVVDHDIGAFFCKFLAYQGPETARAAGHEDVATFEGVRHVDSIEGRKSEV